MSSDLMTSGIDTDFGSVAYSSEQARAAALTLAEMAIANGHSRDDLRTAVHALGITVQEDQP